MCGGVQEAGNERAVIDEETELHLVSRPMRWAVKQESEYEDEDRREQRGFSEECAG
jgi:hypothetical protein